MAGGGSHPPGGTWLLSTDRMHSCAPGLGLCPCAVLAPSHAPVLPLQPASQSAAELTQDGAGARVATPPHAYGAAAALIIHGGGGRRVRGAGGGGGPTGLRTHAMTPAVNDDTGWMFLGFSQDLLSNVSVAGENGQSICLNMNFD